MTQCGKHAILVEHKSWSNNSNLSETILNGLSVILCMSFRVIGAVPYLKWHVFEHTLHRRTFHNFFSKDFRQASDLPTSKCEKNSMFSSLVISAEFHIQRFFSSYRGKNESQCGIIFKGKWFFRKIHAFHKMFLCEAQLRWSSNLHRIMLRPFECFLRGWNCLKNFCASIM